MSRLQPTLQQAEAVVRGVLHWITRPDVREVTPIGWCFYETRTGERRVEADGYFVKIKRQRGGFCLRWPMSDISRRCEDCGCVLRDRRDAGGNGFRYDQVWLNGDPARRDPSRDPPYYSPRYACLSCFNRVRPALNAAYEANRTRLLINRIKQEARHAA